MTKLLVMPTSTNIGPYLEDTDGFLYGYQNMSINFLTTVDINWIQMVLPKLKEKNKQLFIALNKNFHNAELENVRTIMKELAKLKIDGILYYDVAVVQIKKEEKLDVPLIWGAEHFTTNYATMNFWQKHGVDLVYVSGEITKQEIIKIKEQTTLPLIVPIFGHLPMFVSERHAIKNYFTHFELQDDSKTYYIEKEGKKYPIIDNEQGTFVYSSGILNGYQEYEEFQKQKIDYVLCNENFIENDIFLQVLKLFHHQNGTDEIIDKLCHHNTNKGFLYQETVYQVKHYE